MKASQTYAVPDFGIRDKLGYLLGELGNSFTFILCSGYLLKFSTDVLGIRAAVIGILIMSVRILDAVTDIAMGWVADRFHPRGEGKFRPWIKWMCVPVSLCCFLIFQAEFAAMPYGVRVAWVIFTYALWGSVFYTAINIPYGSMASAVAVGAKQRAQISVWRSAGTAMASLAIGAGIPLFVYVGHHGQLHLSGSRMMLLAGGFSLLALLSYLLCYYLVRERVPIPGSSRSVHLWKKLCMLLTNRAVLGILLAVVFLLAATLAMQGMATYVFPIHYHNVGIYSLASAAGSAGVLVICSPLAPHLAERMGKRRVSALFCLVASVLFFCCLVVHPDSPWFYGAVYTLSYVCIGFFNALVWAMIMDVVDNVARLSGNREDGLIYAIYSFCRKLGQALAPGTIGIFLGVLGYNRETAHTAAMGNRLFQMGCLLPGVGFLCAALVLLFVYPLEKKGQRPVGEKTSN